MAVFHTLVQANVLLLVLGMVATGIVGGLLAGLLGVGGGIVVVPVLHMILGVLGVDDAVRMHVAVATSLATMIVTASVSARAHWRRGAVDLGLLVRWAPSLFVGAVAGVAVARVIDSGALAGIFGTVAASVALYMAARGKQADAAADEPDRLPSGHAAQIMPFGIAAFSALMGLGGGTLSVPILTAFRVPIRRAVGSAAAFGLVIAIPGAIGFVIAGWGHPRLPSASLGYVNLIGVALIAPITMIAVPWGTRLAHSIRPATLQRAFALFLAITSCKMLLAAGLPLLPSAVAAPSRQPVASHGHGVAHHGTPGAVVDAPPTGISF